MITTHLPLKSTIRFQTEFPSDHTAIARKLTSAQFEVDYIGSALSNPYFTLKCCDRFLKIPANSTFPIIYDSPIPISDPIPFTAHIPKHIVQTWKSSDLSQQMEYAISTVKKYNPDFEYFFFTDETRKEIIYQFPKEVQKAYASLIPEAFKTDLWRYCFLEKNGGVYLDSKIVLQRPLYSLTNPNTRLILADDLFPSNIYNAILASPPNHPLMKEIIQQATEQILAKNPGIDNLDITGPRALGRAFAKVYNIACAQWTLEKLAIPEIIVLKNDPSTGGKRILDHQDSVIGYTHFSSYYNKENPIQNHHSTLWKTGKIFIPAECDEPSDCAETV